MYIDSTQRKKVTVIHKYIVESFSVGDWHTLGQLTGSLDLIQNHPRLFRSMSFGDEDYDYCVSEVVNKICEENPEHIVIQSAQAYVDLLDYEAIHGVEHSSYCGVEGKVTGIRNALSEIEKETGIQ